MSQIEFVILETFLDIFVGRKSEFLFIYLNGRNEYGKRQLGHFSQVGPNRNS